MDAPETLTEQAYGEMVQNALSACIQAEAGTQSVLAHLAKASGNGRPSLISMPGQPPVVLNALQKIQVDAALLMSLRVLLQTTRITLVALNDLDTRLRSNQAATEARNPNADPDNSRKGPPLRTPERGLPRPGETRSVKSNLGEPESQGS